MPRATDRQRRLWRFVAALSVLVSVAACESTPRTLVVLLPEADGKVGEVTVKTAGGTTTLNKAGTATGIGSGSSAPQKAFQFGDDRVHTIFATAIEAQPEPPVTFTLYFYSDQTRMKEESEAQWPKILAEIRRRKSPDISLVGHTDRYGPASYNEPLSRRRARIIRRRLQKEAVDPAIIDISWHGEKNPIVKTRDGVREPRNRRVEVVIR